MRSHSLIQQGLKIAALTTNRENMTDFILGLLWSLISNTPDTRHNSLQTMRQNKGIQGWASVLGAALCYPSGLRGEGTLRAGSGSLPYTLEVEVWDTASRQESTCGLVCPSRMLFECPPDQWKAPSSKSYL